MAQSFQQNSFAEMAGKFGICLTLLVNSGQLQQVGRDVPEEYQVSLTTNYSTL